MKQEYLFLLLHGSAVSLLLDGGDHLVRIDSGGGKDAVQHLNSLLIQGGLPAQDPGKFHAEQAKVTAAVDQRVTLVIGGEHPIRTGGRRYWENVKKYESQSSGDIQRTHIATYEG